MSRKKRIELVKQVLREQPKTRSDKRELLVRVYQAYGAYTLEDILNKKLPSPSGIDRDRRRKEILEEFPREDKDFKAYKEYTSEFVDHEKWARILG